MYLLSTILHIFLEN